MNAGLVALCFFRGSGPVVLGNPIFCDFQGGPDSLPTPSGSAHENVHVLLDFSLTVKAATLIIISGCGSAISSAKEGKSGFIYNLVKSY